VKQLEFHADALAELEEQALFYEERSAGLGDRFVSEVEAALALAASMPGVGSPHKYGTQRVFPKDFPCAVVYRHLQETDVVQVLAIAPFRRKPGYWRSRG
jgi:toxin ParE1/3/4